MFPIDITLLPSLTTRKALLVVDAQNDFLAVDGALPTKEPVDLAQRISNLAQDFRNNGGEIIWVQSQFESSRPVGAEQIMLSDAPSPSTEATIPARGRRPRMAVPELDVVVSPEAFLTLGPGTGLPCARSGTSGAEMHPTVRQAVGPKDHTLTKTFYSAFKSDALLRLLRVRLVTELFICGSLTNVGVMATAIDAASYGYTITIVDDCCGSQSVTRHEMALRQITSTTGCEALSAFKVLSAMTPKPKPKPKSAASREVGYERRSAASGRSPTVRVRRGKEDAAALSASDIQPFLEKLSLSDEHAAATDGLALTSRASPQQQRPENQSRPQPRSRSQSQSQPSSTVQPVAWPDHPQIETQRDRDTVAPRSTQRATTGRRSSAAPKQSDHGDGSGRGSGDGRLGGENLDGNHYESVNFDELHRFAVNYSPRVLADTERDGLGAVQNANGAAPPREHESLKAATSAYSISRDGLSHSSSNIADPFNTSGERKNPEEKRKKNKKNNKKRNNTMAALQDAHQTESDPFCEGDTKVVYDILPESLEHNIFERINTEVSWERMSHQGGEVPRLVAVQGRIEADGSKPVYRHPADESPPLRPFTAAVDEIRRVVEARLGHPLNHVLIQFYRHGNDYISEHSDKTLDIARNSFIANVSLGAERTMTLRTKRSSKEPGMAENGGGSDDSPKAVGGLERQIQRARLPHNSLFQMGLATNMRWMHAIRQDKRLAIEKTPTELAYNGARISLTFRRIATFLDAEEAYIWGQGATAKTRDTARAVVNGQTQEAVAMLKAFGRENRSSEFDWEAYYGSGFDVLHISAAPRLFLSEDTIVNLRLRIMLAEFGVSYARGSVSTAKDGSGGPTNHFETSTDVAMKFVDNDEAKTTVVGQRDIMLYLQDKYRGGPENDGRVPPWFQEGLEILDSWRSLSSPSSFWEYGDSATRVMKLLADWEEDAVDDVFIAGPVPGLADFAFWPVLHDIFSSASSQQTEEGGNNTDSREGKGKQPSPSAINKQGEPMREDERDQQQDNLRLPNLRAYYGRMRARGSVVRVLG
ncbi:isochorismatase [Nemania sp. FL0916]|nr:isochorismatase [Nemania sp. FL0916]